MSKLVQMSADGIIKIITLDGSSAPVGKPHWAKVKHAVGSGNNIKFTNLSAAPSSFVHEREFRVNDYVMDISGTSGTIPVSDKVNAIELLQKFPEPKIASPSALPPSSKFNAAASGATAAPADPLAAGASSASSASPSVSPAAPTTTTVSATPSSVSSVSSAAPSGGSTPASASALLASATPASTPPVTPTSPVSSSGGSTTPSSTMPLASTATTSASPSSSASITSGLGGAGPASASIPSGTALTTGPALSIRTPGAAPTPSTVLPTAPVIPTPSTAAVANSAGLKTLADFDDKLFAEIKKAVNMVVSEKYGYSLPNSLEIDGKILKKEMKRSLSDDRKTITLAIPYSAEGGGVFSSAKVTDRAEVTVTSQSVSLENGNKFNNAVFAAMIATACEYLYKKQGVHPLILDLNLQKLGIGPTLQADFEDNLKWVIKEVSTSLKVPDSQGLIFGRDISFNYITSPAPAPAPASTPTATPPAATPLATSSSTAASPSSSTSLSSSAPSSAATPLSVPSTAASPSSSISPSSSASSSATIPLVTSSTAASPLSSTSPSSSAPSVAKTLLGTLLTAASPSSPSASSSVPTAAATPLSAPSTAASPSVSASLSVPSSAPTPTDSIATDGDLDDLLFGRDERVPGTISGASTSSDSAPTAAPPASGAAPTTAAPSSPATPKR